MASMAGIRGGASISFSSNFGGLEVNIRLIIGFFSSISFFWAWGSFSFLVIVGERICQKTMPPARRKAPKIIWLTQGPNNLADMVPRYPKYPPWLIPGVRSSNIDESPIVTRQEPKRREDKMCFFLL